MDEPMESVEPDSTRSVEGGSTDNDRRQAAQLLRPGSMGKTIHNGLKTLFTGRPAAPKHQCQGFCPEAVP